MKLLSAFVKPANFSGATSG